MPSKFSQVEVEAIFAEKGCQLLEIYQANEAPMKYRCKCGQIAQASFYGFRKSKGCRKCSSWNQERKFTYEEVEQDFEKNGCELLENEYIDNNALMNYKCSCGTVSKVRYRDFRRGRRCQKCKGNNLSAQFRTTDTTISALCEQNGCQLLESFIYKKHTRIKFICKCGEPWEAYLSNFKKCPNCRKCGSEKISGDKCHMWNPDRDQVALNKKYRRACSRMLRWALEATGQNKTDHTYTLLGYTGEELQQHIRNHPDYFGDDGLEIDHFFPIQAFLDHKIHDMRVINALDNLRPMRGADNVAKADKYDEVEFTNWLKTKLDTI